MIGGTIPIRPHLKKFIQYIENLEVDAPIDIYGKGIVALTLKMLLTFKTHIEIHESRSLPKELTETIQYTVTLSHFNRGKLHLSKAGIIEFDKFIHSLMHEVLLQKVLMYIKTGRQEKDAINDFCDDVGIDEEISFEGLKKSNYRLRNAKKITHFYAKSVRAARAS